MRTRFQRKGLLAAGFQNTELAVPWWGGRKLKISFD
jgi:hypothetical protein